VLLLSAKFYSRKKNLYWIDRAVLRKKNAIRAIIPLQNGDIDYSQRLTSVIRVQSVKLLILDPRSSEDQNQLQLPFLLFVLADFQDKMPKEFFRSMSVPTISNNWCQTKQYKETRTNYMLYIYCNRSSVPSRIQRFGQVFKRRIWDQVMQ